MTCKGVRGPSATLAWEEMPMRLQPSPSAWPSVTVSSRQTRALQEGEWDLLVPSRSRAKPGERWASTSRHHPSLAAPGPGAGPGSVLRPWRARVITIAVTGIYEALTMCWASHFYVDVQFTAVETGSQGNEPGAM